MTADVLILGAGPGGSTLARLLADAGLDVLLLDRAETPPFKVGESLLPAGVALCREMGLGDALEQAGFLRKHGVRFVLDDDGAEERFDFGDALRGAEQPYAYEVQREGFDTLLQEFAESGGVRFLRGVDVSDVDLEAGDGVAATARDGRRFDARFLVDATGPAGLLVRRLGLRVPIDGLSKASIFGHFAHVPRAAGDAAGDIVILCCPAGWIWIIPFADGSSSVGVVGEPDTLRAAGAADGARFDRLCSRSDVLRRYLDRRETLRPLLRRGDFSFRAREVAGERFLLVGDAAGFIDPVFSSGVFLAQKGAFLARDCIAPALAAGRLPSPDERHEFATQLRLGQERFLSLVRQFYDTSFRANIVRTRRRHHLRQALTSLLAGDIYDPENVWVRMGIVQ